MTNQTIVAAPVERPEQTTRKVRSDIFFVLLLLITLAGFAARVYIACQRYMAWDEWEHVFIASGARGIDVRVEDLTGDGEMIQPQSLLGHHFLQVAIAEGIKNIPAQTQHNDFVTECRPRNRADRLSLTPHPTRSRFPPFATQPDDSYDRHKPVLSRESLRGSRKRFTND